MTCPVPDKRLSALPRRRACQNRRLCCLVVLLVILPSVGYAQTNESISGAVYDSVSGNPVAGALVRLEGSGFTAVSGSDGRFVFLSVPAGSWRLVVERVGYRQSAPLAVETVEGFEEYVRLPLVPEPVELPPQVVEGGGGNGARNAVAVRRYTREVILRAGHRTVAEALDAIPGVRVYGSAETPGGTRVSVGGESPQRVAVLWDGLPLATGADGAVDLDAIPLDALAAIEVSPGSRSAASGDAAIGGTVNLRSRTSSAVGTQRTELWGGSFGAYRGTASATQHLGGVRGDWVLERFGRGDTFTYPAADSTASRHGAGINGWRAYLGSVPFKDRRLRTSAFWYRSDVGAPGALEELTPDARKGNERFRVQGQWQGGNRSFWAMDAAAWFEASSERYRSPVRRTNDTKLRERFFGGRADGRLTLAGVAARVEIESRVRRLEGIDLLRPRFSFGVQDRLEFSLRQTLSRQFQVGPHGVSLTLSGAIDGDDHAPPVYSPRLDLGWTLPLGIQTRLGWGRSFRRPLLTSLFWKADAFALGNPDLRPERASEWDIGIEIRKRFLVADSRYFERRVRDMIVWERSTVLGQYKPINVSRTLLFGREDHLRLALPNDALSLDYNHVFNAAYDRSGEVNIDGEVLPLTPRHTHELGAASRFGRWNIRLEARWVSRRETRRANTRGKTLAAYRTFDAFIQLRLRKSAPRVDLNMRLDNLSDERADLLERYPSPGRSWSVGTTFEL